MKSVLQSLSLLEGSEEILIEKFRKANLKILAEQIRIRENEIDDLKEKIEEKNLTFAETAYNVDLTKIKTTDDRKSYITSYNKKLSGILDEIEKLEADIEVKGEEINRFYKIINLLES